jgi:hypothetical protein
MPLGDGFGGKDAFEHGKIILSYKKPPVPGGRVVSIRTSSADFLAGFGTLQMQVAGLHRAGPSATLDKAVQLYQYFTRFFLFVKKFFGESINFYSL